MPTTNELSSIAQDWITPWPVFNWLNTYFDFTLDACATHTSAKCLAYHTLESNGLLQSWATPNGSPHHVFVNPPYGKDEHGESLQEPWFRKAYNEMMVNNVLSTLLVPPRTATKWWHAYVPVASEVWFITPRIDFIDARTGKPKRQNTTPSCLVVFDPSVIGNAMHQGPRTVFAEIGKRPLFHKRSGT